MQCCICFKSVHHIKRNGHPLNFEFKFHRIPRQYPNILQNEAQTLNFSHCRLDWFCLLRTCHVRFQYTLFSSCFLSKEAHWTECLLHFIEILALNPISTVLFCLVVALGGGTFCTPSPYKIWSRQPRELKLGGLEAHVMFFIIYLEHACLLNRSAVPAMDLKSNMQACDVTC